MAESPSEPRHEVDPSELRALFRDARIEERALAGELSTEVRKGSEHPAPDRVGEPAGTLSHMLVYLDSSGRAVALAHEYLRPDGSIGASGLRDPKWLRFRGAVWMVKES